MHPHGGTSSPLETVCSTQVVRTRSRLHIEALPYPGKSTQQHNYSTHPHPAQPPLFHAFAGGPVLYDELDLARSSEMQGEVFSEPFFLLSGERNFSGICTS